MKQSIQSILFSALFLFAIAPATVNAQGFECYPVSSRDSSGRIVRSGYISNPWYDNWDISVGGGISSLTAHGNTMKISPSYDISLTKWGTPSLAFRFGIQGFQGKEGYTPNFLNHSPLPYDASKNIVSWDYFYAHADMMWCASNTIFGYNFRRFYSFTPYIHGGYQRIFDPEAYKDNYDNEMVFGAGVMNTFRISDRLNFTLDLRASNFSGRFHDNVQGRRATLLTASAGIALKIFKPGWRRVKELEDARDAAVAAEAAALASLEEARSVNSKLSDGYTTLCDKNRELSEEINALKNVAVSESELNGADELLRRIADADLVIYYEINKDEIRSGEELHINDYVNEVLSKDPKHVFYITGSADKGTGTSQRNSFLSNSRVNRVKQYLMDKFDIPESQIVIKGAIVTDKHADGRIDRCVLFENE